MRQVRKGGEERLRHLSCVRARGVQVEHLTGRRKAILGTFTHLRERGTALCGIREVGKSVVFRSSNPTSLRVKFIYYWTISLKRWTTVTDEAPDGISLLDLGTDAGKPVDENEDAQRDPDKFTERYEKSVMLDQVRGVVRQFGEDGIAASVVGDMVDVSTETARKHLEDLRRLREVYRQKHNKQVHLYYPNGRPLHGLGTRRIESEMGDLILEVQLAQGKGEELFFHIKEKRFSLLEGERTEGAVMFPLDHLDELFSELNDLASEVQDE